MGIFGSKWMIVKVSNAKVILSDNRSIVPVNILDGKIEYDRKRYRLPKSVLDKVQAIVDSRKRNSAIK